MVSVRVSGSIQYGERVRRHQVGKCLHMDRFSLRLRCAKRVEQTATPRVAVQVAQVEVREREVSVQNLLDAS